MQPQEKMNDVYSQYALPEGTMVQEYKIIKTLGIGNFGIVYSAKNKYFSEIVALKEFLPAFLACRSQGEHRVRPLSSETEKAYEWSRHKFLQEAKTLRELGHPAQHPNIVRVIQFIEANDTAYMVMDLEKGLSLKTVLEERETLPENEIRCIQSALLDGLERVHEANVWHRDIKPSNILIRSDGSPVLIDFGAARKDITGTDRSTMAVYSPAFAAPEQIRPMADQGPWTDIYSMGATLYRVVTGKLPANATSRMQDKALIRATEAAYGNYSPTMLEAIDAALEFDPKDRPQSISEWKQMFGQNTEVAVSNKILPLTSSKNRKTKTIKSMLTAFSFAIIAFVVVGFWAYQRQDSPAQAQQQFYPIADNGQAQKKEETKIPTGNDLNEPAPEPSPSILLANVNINSIPENAQVFLNGELKGTTPVSTELTEGMHQIRLHLEGHHDWESNLIIEDSGEMPLRIPMLKHKKGVAKP